MNVIGLDIGTTGLCALVIDSESGKILKKLTAPNDTKLVSEKSLKRNQDPDQILDKSKLLDHELYQAHRPIAAIGVTGQMHGILYIDRQGRALSPLYTWQDESGNEPFNAKQSYAQYLSEASGYKMAAGFGATTYFYHKSRGLVPKGSQKICTVHDYVAMKLCGKTQPLMHTSDAASLGLFDLDKLEFDKTAIELTGLDFSLFPQVSSKFEILGYYKNEIPVSIAIGDNQASYIGSVKDLENSLLVNVGTGSQISFLAPDTQVAKGLEICPLYEDRFLCLGSSLCGGRAFALLEHFFCQTVELIVGKSPDQGAYPAMYDFLDSSIQDQDPLKVSTLFSGTRDNPSQRGSIENIGTENFTPGNLIWGFLDAIAQELFEMYHSSGIDGKEKLIGSGGGLRKNKVLCGIFEDKFGLNLTIPKHEEEAAFGAALFALIAGGIKENLSQAGRLIAYLD